jgi:signal transduction histidine kinase
MNRLVVRLVLSHLLVAVVGALATALVVRALAPPMFDRQMGMMGGGGIGRGPQLRHEFATAIDWSLVAGTSAGVVAAGAFGMYAAYRLMRPLAALGAATREIATGRLQHAIPRPGTRELDDLADDIRTLSESLAETEVRRTRLLGEVAHEMRTPLTVVEGYVEGMIDGVLPTDDATLEQVSDEMRRLHRLADDLSALSRAEEGRFDLARVQTALGPLLRSIVERLHPQADDAGITLAVRTEPSPEILIDPDRIAQIVTNLVGNALRSTPPGGTVEVSLLETSRGARISVTDTGEGLDAADLERVFERFYRVPGRRRGHGAGDGSGIGLTLSRRLAQAHGGSLEARSAGLGRGATFVLDLPRR